MSVEKELIGKIITFCDKYDTNLSVFTEIKESDIIKLRLLIKILKDEARRIYNQ